MQITTDQAKAIRRKQADNMLTAKETAQAIGVTPVTYRRLIRGGEFRNSVYIKAMEWLAKDY
ncbi:hypothetical protein [Streptococcus sp. FT1-106]|uniref:hypothetical protein n=1 Tax=Streptococcus sp. FT1-106 TaxID=3409994 RepID=UPI003BF4AD25